MQYAKTEMSIYITFISDNERQVKRLKLTEQHSIIQEITQGL